MNKSQPRAHTRTEVGDGVEPLLPHGLCVVRARRALFRVIKSKVAVLAPKLRADAGLPLALLVLGHLQAGRRAGARYYTRTRARVF